MRKILTLLVMVFMTMVVVAQNNSVISYQAVVRDGQNRLAINEAVSVTISVLDANNTVQYTETENVTTNANGLISLNIGDGDPTAFAAISWIDAKFQTTINLTNLGYQVTNTSPVSVVPVAMYALSSPEGFSGDYDDLTNKPTIPTVPTNVSNFTNDAGYITSADVPTNLSAFSNDAGYLTRDSLGDCTCLTAAELQALLDRIDALEETLANQGSDTTDTAVDAQPCPGAPTVTDVDGNVYITVQIGDQCWMRENLRTTKYANGTPIPLGTEESSTTAYRYYPSGNSANVPDYGYLYNWPAVMNGSLGSSANPSGVQGICPDGWHVPSDAEWTELENYVSSQSQYVCGSSTSYIAKALASEEGWISSTDNCAVGNNPDANNATGFSARPAGYYGDIYYYIGNIGNGAYFWSATQYSSNNAYNRYLAYIYANVSRYSHSKHVGNSVRCVRD